MTRKTLQKGAVLTTALAVAVTGVAITAPASGLHGEAVIEPIESNLAAKYWTQATATAGGDTAGHAVDQDPGTAWIATAGESLTLDLGGAYDNARKISLTFPDPGASYEYRIEASADGDSWETVADEQSASGAGAGAVHLVSHPGMRYVKVTVLGASGDARIGVSELEAYNYLREDITLGADMSWSDGDNREYWVSPLEEDRGAGPHLFDVAQDRGMDFVRLRIFNEPRSEGSGQVNTTPLQGPERSLAVAEQIVDHGMELGIDFHYADSWADPGKQPKPRAWAELPFDELTDSVYDYTHDYIEQLIAQGTTPDKVAVGNEILHGMMWGSEAQLSEDDSAPVWAGANPAYFRDQAEIYQSQPGGGILWQYWDSEDPEEQALYLESFDRFTTLLASGIDAVRDASPETRVELHSIIRNEGYDDLPGLDMALEFWDQVLTRLEAQDSAPDSLGHSYYPEWHGGPDKMERQLQTISAAHPDYLMTVPETSYPASGAGGAPMPNSTYPRTVQGQADAIQRVFAMVNDLPGNKGASVLTWEPQRWQSMFSSVPGLENTSQPNASIDVYNKSAATHVLEDHVYLTGTVGEDIDLPTSVQVLDVATDEVTSTNVSWASLRQLDEGRTILTGTTEHGMVEAVIDVSAAPPALELDAQVATRCALGKTQLTVTTLNTADGPVALAYETDYGTKSYEAIQPGKNAFHAFTTRLADLPAGEVTVTATAQIDGESVTTTDVVDYAARSCG